MSSGSVLVLRTSHCLARQPRCSSAGFATAVLTKQLDGGWETPIRRFFRSIGVGAGTPGTSSRRTANSDVKRLGKGCRLLTKLAAERRGRQAENPAILSLTSKILRSTLLREA